MIFGHINDLAKFSFLPAPILKALQHIKDTDFLAKPAGNYDLQGKDIFVQVIDTNTKNVADTRPEVHKQYLDVQFLVKGNEKIGVTFDTGKNTVSEDFLKEKDLLFYTGVENESWLTFIPGNFAIFLPNDVHRPVCAVNAPEAIRKVVIKVKLSLL